MNRFYKLVFMAIYVLGSYYTFKGIMHNILRYQQYNSIFTQKEADQGEKKSNFLNPSPGYYDDILFNRKWFYPIYLLYS